MVRDTYEMNGFQFFNSLLILIGFVFEDFLMQYHLVIMREIPRCQIGLS